MAEILTIKKLIERINGGDIRIPAFQRNYVWEPDQVAFLLDSIYKGYPIGTVFLWRTEQQLNYEKNLGRYTLPKPKKSYPVNYVLDGQQRITSLFSVFQKELHPNPNDKEWVNIYFDMKADGARQDSYFIPLHPEDIISGRHFDVSTIFDPREFRNATKTLTNIEEDLILKLQEKFQSYFIPNEVFESNEKADVAIVFERINRAGTPLDAFELLAAWSWSEEFSLIDKFEELGVTIEQHGYASLSKNKEMQLKICSAATKGVTTPKAIFEMTGQSVREEFSEISAGIIGAIDFLTRELNTHSFELLPFPSMLIPLSVFFKSNKKDGHKYNAAQGNELKAWFWRTVFSRRYASDVNGKQEKDIAEMLKLKDDPTYKLPGVPLPVSIDFTDSTFNVQSVNTKVLIAMLANCQPKSLLSGASVDLKSALKAANKNEFHHIFPKKHLESLKVDAKKINCLANFCFLSRGDNITIKDKAPAIYNRMLNTSLRDGILKASAIPTDFDKLSYDVFITERKKLLNQIAFNLQSKYSPF
ncbi:DUF262 domain-containing protein [Rahnella sp. R3(2024)]|uniref:GmrSD restriction endonuclease domain-containing protein n=1 Tax=Rahnella sp. R3(2024) TaxID=3163550 RepID=UPI0036E632EE